MNRFLLIGAFLVMAPLAVAQDLSDYDMTPAPVNSNYLADDGTPAVANPPASDAPPGDAEFNMSVPAEDTSYLLDDAIPPAVHIAQTDDGSGTSTPAQPTAKAPGFEAALVLVAAAAVVLVIARRR